MAKDDDITQKEIEENILNNLNEPEIIKIIKRVQKNVTYLLDKEAPKKKRVNAISAIQKDVETLSYYI